MAPAAPTASASVHLEGSDDEPMELDVDIEITCACGATDSHRTELYALKDWVSYFCWSCDTEIRVDITTTITLSCSAAQTGRAMRS